MDEVNECTNNEVYIDDEMVDTIKQKRKELKFTQEDVATMLNISSKKYSRIETRNITKIDKKTLNRLFRILGLEKPNLIQDYGTRCSFVLNLEMKKDLEFLKSKKGFSSLSETIKYCISTVLNEFFMEQISTVIQDDIREAISNTYSAELQKLALQNGIYEMLLAKIDENTSVDFSTLKKELENFVIHVSHCDKY